MPRARGPGGRRIWARRNTRRPRRWFLRSPRYRSCPPEPHLPRLLWPSDSASLHLLRRHAPIHSIPLIDNPAQRHNGNIAALPLGPEGEWRLGGHLDPRLGKARLSHEFRRRRRLGHIRRVVAAAPHLI